MVGRCTASATASASRKSFLWPLRKGFMNCPRTSFTSWPRAQKLLALMVGADASLHANQAQRRRERQRKTGL